MTHRLLQAARSIRLSGWSRRAWPMMIAIAPLTCCQCMALAGEASGVAPPSSGAQVAAPRPALGRPQVENTAQAPKPGLTDRRSPSGYAPLELWRSAQNANRPPEPVRPAPQPASALSRPQRSAPAPAPSRLEQTYLPLQRWQQAHARFEPHRADPNSAPHLERLPPSRPVSIKSTGPETKTAASGDGGYATPSAFTAVHRLAAQPEPASPPEPVLKSADPTPEPMPEEGILPGARTQAETVDAPVVLPEPEDVFVIDLPTTIRLVLSANPTVQGAQEAVREMLALQQKARVMLLPSLNAGTAYHNHQGNLQASTGQMKNIYNSSLYYGAGTRVWAAESLAIPGVRVFAHLGDAIYEPLAVRQEVVTKRFDSRATANTLVLNAIVRYFDLLNAEGRYLAAKQTELETAEIVRITASYALTGQGREGDANRARTEAYLMHTEVQRAEGRVAEASALLAELLNLNPTTRLKTVGGPIAGVSLFGPREELESLIRMAERRRPEIVAANSTVRTNATRVRQEQTRPLFPLVSLGYSAGSFGGGGVLFPGQLGKFGGRSDFDVLALWSLQNMGVGNYATVSERRAVLNESRAERTRAVNGVRQEVIASYGLLQGERIQIQITQRQLKDTEEGFREEFQRLRGAEALPIEVLNSVGQLGFARKELIKAVTAYNQAQFRLLVATGISPTQALIRGLDQPVTAPESSR